MFVGTTFCLVCDQIFDMIHISSDYILDQNYIL